MKKSTFLTYAGLSLCALGGGLATASDSDVLQFAIPLLFGGAVLFVENLKLGIAEAICERLTGQVNSDRMFVKEPVIALHRDNGLQTGAVNSPSD